MIPYVIILVLSVALVRALRSAIMWKHVASVCDGHILESRNEMAAALSAEMEKSRKLLTELKTTETLLSVSFRARCSECGCFVSKVDHEAHPGICSRCSTKKNREIKKQVLRDNPVDGVSEYAANAGVEY